MNPFDNTVMPLLFGLLVSIGANAQEGISRNEYKAGKEHIEANYKTAKETCDSLAGNQKDICVAEAKGGKNVAQAELEARYRPGSKNDYNVRVAKAEAAYEVAKERCDDQSGNAKDVCLKKAKSDETAAKADARANKETAKAGKESTDARREARDEKTEAEYKVAREKCDDYSGNAKDRCLAEAKARFNK